MKRWSTFLVMALAASHARAAEPSSSATDSHGESPHDPAGSPEGTVDPNSDAELTKRNEASLRFQKGLAFYEEGEPRLALVEFEKAYELVPDYRVLYNLALVAIQIGQFAKARTSFEDYLREGGENVLPERRRDVERDLEVLRARTALLRVETIPPGTTVTVDDVPVGDSPIEEALILDVGQHRVAFRKDGYEQKAERVTLAGGEERTIRAELKVVAPKIVRIREPAVIPGPVRSGPSTAAWVSWGVTAALATGAIATGIYGIGQANSLDALKQTPNPDGGTMNQLSSSASAALLATDILAVGAGVALGTSVYLTFWGPGRKDDARSGAVRMGVVPSGVRVFGEF